MYALNGVGMPLAKINKTGAAKGLKSAGLESLNKHTAGVKQTDSVRTPFSAFFKPGLHAEVQQLQKKLKNSSVLSSRELLYYQIRVGQLGLRVELVSKLADSLMSTVRKLQGGQ